jgi:hypothetical protein
MSDSEFDPAPAKGLGADVFDQPALFFLTHQPTIEQWARLNLAAAAATHQWLSTTVRDSLAELAVELGMELSTVAGPNYWQHLLMHPTGDPNRRRRAGHWPRALLAYPKGQPELQLSVRRDTCRIERGERLIPRSRRPSGAE